MQIAIEIRRILHLLGSKSPVKVSIADMELEFSSGTDTTSSAGDDKTSDGRDKPKPSMTREQATIASKSKWLTAVGLDPSTGQLLKNDQPNNQEPLGLRRRSR